MFYFPTSNWIFVLAAFVIFVIMRGGKAVSSLAKPLPYDYGNDKEDLPCHLSLSPDGYSYITWAYYNKTTKKYVAGIDCHMLHRRRWIEAKSEEELKEMIEQLFLENKKECQALES